MQCLLNDQKIAASRAKVDGDELNAALHLAYFFSKKRICSLRIQDVYDGSDILPFISPDEDKPPRQTEDLLKDILTSQIRHLKQKQPIEQDSPLFPGYFGNSGEKKLQRHIADFTDYHDFNAIKKALRADQYQQPAQAGDDSVSRVKKIAADTGKSVRTIARSLGKAPVAGIPSLGRGEKLSDDDPRQFLKMLDAMVVLPEIQALDENSVSEIISSGFDIIDRTFPDSAINEMRYSLIKAIDDRIGEIEKELLDGGKS